MQGEGGGRGGKHDGGNLRRGYDRGNDAKPGDDLHDDDGHYNDGGGNDFLKLSVL